MISELVSLVIFDESHISVESVKRDMCPEYLMKMTFQKRIRS